MARTLIQIQEEIFNRIASDETLVALNSVSKYAKWRLMVFVVSVSIWVLENLFDTATKEVEDAIAQKGSHNKNWYRTKALEFQYGFDLITDTDKYENTSFTDEVIEASKVIKYSAVTQNAGKLLIKIASEVGTVLAPITVQQKASFDAYIEEIADEGVNYLVINNPPDLLLLDLLIFCDPLVLNDTGMSILDGNYPVEHALLEFMKELPFNGEFIKHELEKKLGAVKGVLIPEIVNAESRIIDDVATGTYKDAQPITVKTVPDAGYFLPQSPDDVTKIAKIEYVV